MSDESVRVSNSIPCYSFVITKRGLLGQAYVAPCSCLTDEAYGSCGQGGADLPEPASAHQSKVNLLVSVQQMEKWQRRWRPDNISQGIITSSRMKSKTPSAASA